MIKKTFTTSEIAQYCQVTPRTVAQWIQEGKIKGYRTPGKHSRVKKEDLINFFEKYDIPIPLELQIENEKKRILVVDDDEGMVKSIKSVLMMENIFTIETAYDGFVAGQKLIKFHPHLIVLDIRMPRLDGYQVCSMIRSDPDNKSIKILVISGMVDIEGPEKIMKAGADDYLPKPFDNKELIKKVNQLLKPG